MFRPGQVQALVGRTPGLDGDAARMLDEELGRVRGEFEDRFATFCDGFQERVNALVVENACIRQQSVRRRGSCGW